MAADKEIRVRAAALTDVGRVRERNEDNYFIMAIGPEDVRPPGVRAVAVVADGMGGHVGGEVASGTAVKLIGGSFVTEDGWGLSRFGDNIVDAIVNLIGEADSRIRSLARGGEKPPGTTLTAAFVIGNSAYIGHVGDSRAYVIRGRTIKAVTEDHSLLGELIRNGKINPKDAGSFEGKNVITRALGAGSKTKIDMPVRVDLTGGDVLLLCSDGLWDLVSDEEILGAIHHESRLNGGLKWLVDRANERGGHDNITVAALEFGRLRRDRRFGGTLIGIGTEPPMSGKAPGDRIQTGHGAGKAGINTPAVVALTTFGLVLTILMFVGFWYAVGALIGLIKGKTGDVQGSENGVEMVVPEKGRDGGGEDKGGVREKKKQKIEMEKSKETKEKKKQPITNLPKGQI